jgi:predicted secreted Zn-dependent protease
VSSRRQAAPGGHPRGEEAGPARAPSRRAPSHPGAAATLLLLGLLLGVPTVNAQAPEPTPAANPLCDWAFQHAAERLVQDPVAIPVEAAPSPPVWPGGDLLDDAVRMCSSVEGFSASAAYHPETLLGVDPFTVLVARCHDPAAGLDAYGPCVSLVRALATPAPTPRPTPTPGPSESPRAQATPRPRANPGLRGRAGPVAAATAVPAIEAGVRGADSIRYLPITGTTWSRLMRSAIRQGTSHCGDHARRVIACVMTRPWLRPSYARDPATGACSITRVETALLAVAYIPKWTAPRRVPAYLAWWWSRMAPRIGWHEAQHVRIATQHIARFPHLVVGKPCTRYGRVARRWTRQLSTAQHAFDRRDYPRLASASRSWLAESRRRFPSS